MSQTRAISLVKSSRLEAGIQGRQHFLMNR